NHQLHHIEQCVTKHLELNYGQVSTIIRNLLLDTKNKYPDKFNSLKETLENRFDFYLDNISFNQDQDLNVTARYSDLCEEKNLSLDFNSSGSGFMQVLQILVPIYRFCPEESTVVLLDEPDAHLHPNLQTALANTLRDIQKELGIQIIISTHSTSIIRAADPSEVIPISSRTTINKPLIESQDVEREISTRIDTYELGKSVISGKLVFIEDDDISVLERFDYVLGTKCFSGTNTVPIQKGRGKDDKLPFQIRNILRDFLGQEIEIHFLRDGDGLNPDWRQRLNEYAEKNNVILHQLQRHEIENYLLSPSLIFKTLSRKYPNRIIPTIEEIESKIIHSLKDTISLNTYNFPYNLEDNIHKTASLLKLEDYRSQGARSESNNLIKTYVNYDNMNNLLIVGMGKETLKNLRAWINNELKLNISQKDILDNLEPTDIPEEIKTILEQLKSKESKSAPSNLPKMEDDDEIEEES
ncbi:AAA family ATPase, partial [Anabaena cylindrica UHCC 0172]|uniref:ATP-dependent nuclease n=1 Tax=Anabaena cylindrica TaxID=1165 RepID=UPI002B220C0F